MSKTNYSQEELKEWKIQVIGPGILYKDALVWYHAQKRMCDHFRTEIPKWLAEDMGKYLSSGLDWKESENFEALAMGEHGEPAVLPLRRAERILQRVGAVGVEEHLAF